MKRDHQAMIALFIIPVYLLTFLNVFWPDAKVSAAENRTLKQKPAFSWSGLASGKLTQEFENYFSDQFPFRDFFINVNHSMVELMQVSFGEDVDIVEGPGEGNDLGEGEHLENDPNDLVTLEPTQPTTGTTSSTTPAETTLPSGETDPSQSGDPSESSGSGTTETTGESTTTTPTSSEPTTTEATTTQTTAPITGEVETVSGVIIIGNRAMELYYYSESRSERYVKLVNRLQDKLAGVSQVYDMVAPTAVEFYSPEKYHDLSSSQVDAIKGIYDRLDGSVKTVDAYSQILPKVQDYLYFRTDHHWTARGAHRAYIAFGQVAGFEAIPLEQFETGIVPGDFLGSLYRYTKSSKLKNDPDFVEYFLPKVTSEGIAFQNTAMTEGYKIQAVRTEVSSTNKYLAFIQGDNPLVRFQTSLKNGRKVVVLKESFGNALVPFLLNHYEEVYVIDPRSLTADLPGFIQANGIQDVLIINYAFSVTNNKWLDGFENMIG